MADGEQTVFCPHCGYPYKMSAVQLDVYRGRNMGCMNCGRPFLVDPPAQPEPSTEPSLVEATANGAQPDAQSSSAEKPTESAKSQAETHAPKLNFLGNVSVGLGLGFLL